MSAVDPRGAIPTLLWRGLKDHFFPPDLLARLKEPCRTPAW